MSIALAQLVVLEAQQVEQLADTRTAIAAIERLASRMPTPSGGAPAAAKRQASSTDVPPAVARALQDGPLLVADFLKQTKLSKYRAAKLVKRGVVVATGTTNSRRYGLPGRPAKEAP